MNNREEAFKYVEDEIDAVEEQIVRAMVVLTAAKESARARNAGETVKWVNKFEEIVISIPHVYLDPEELN